jgi:H+/Cl- antiporter ClcA/CBS domain-containing protein
MIEKLQPHSLRDFTADSRMLMLSAIALVLGAVSSVLAWILLSLINLATNVFYFHKWNTQFRSPADNHLGWLAIFVPVIGGVLIGTIARFGSDKIRGHGIPETLEAIILRGARVDARVALLKPLATAISIGSGGPFGAEGPIIVTAGSTGSLIAQTFNLSDAERTTLMVAGATAGMAATFSTPVAAVLLAVELLLFEWRPRSLVPVSVACAMAGVMRRFLLGPGPIFPMPLTTTQTSLHSMAGALAVGVAAGLMSALLGRTISFFEAGFEKLPVHWMWWPAIGGIGIGIGGLIFPRALGVGYDVIKQMIAGDFTWKLLVGVLVVKFLIWAFSLGSGTAGGVLAPLLMIGCALGGAMTHVLPPIDPGGWPLLGSAAMIAGSLGAPLTAAVLGLELTHNGGLLLPLLMASVTAYAITVLIQPRSILTEGLAKRGHHMMREYGVDPLEVLTVRDVMRTSVLAIPPDATGKDAQQWLDAGGASEPVERAAKRQLLFPLVEDGKLTGVLTRGDLWRAGGNPEPQTVLLKTMARSAKTVDPDETLRAVAEEMANSGVTTFPVVASDSGELMGLVGFHDVLQARARSQQREANRERVLRLRWPFGGSRKAEEAETN